MEMPERVKILRNSLGLTQTEFGNKIGFRQNTVGQMENGQRGITDRTILLICQTFNVNEEWLRNSTGEMFKQDEDAKLAQEFSLSKLGQAIIRGYSRLSDSEKAAVSKCVNVFAEEYEKTNNSQGNEPNIKLESENGKSDIDREVEDYRRELEEEKSTQTSSASQNTDAKIV